MNFTTRQPPQSELLADARERGQVWTSSRGIKDCILGLIFVFIGQVLMHVPYKEHVERLWASIWEQGIYDKTYLYQFVQFLLIVGCGFGFLILLIVLIQTRGFISFRGYLESEPVAAESSVVPVLRIILAVFFLVLMGREVLPKAYMLTEQAVSPAAYIPIFQAIFSRAALFFLVIGIVEVVAARRRFIREITAQKASD